MALVTSVLSQHALGQEGGLATTGDYKTVTVRSTTEDLKFGRVALRGASDDLAILPAGSAGVVMGVVLRREDIEPSQLAGTGDIPAGHSAICLRKGRVWVVPEVNVTQGQEVYYRHANTTPDAAPAALGRFRNDADTADATLLPGAVWASSASAGALAILEVNLP